MHQFDEPELSRDGHQQWWVEPSDADTDAAAAAAGLHVHRRLLQLRRPLPLTDHPAAHIETRAFRPGDDDDAWLALNAAAFAEHPDQGRWTIADLQRTLAEEWFDPEGFLLHEIDGELAGFCWTKVHPASGDDGARGEIFIIGVDPRFHGHGLGRALTVAGLDWLARHAHVATAMLYVEADNEPARNLYASMGFQVHSTRTGYEQRGAT